MKRSSSTSARQCGLSPLPTSSTRSAAPDRNRDPSPPKRSQLVDDAHAGSIAAHGRAVRELSTCSVNGSVGAAPRRRRRERRTGCDRPPVPTAARRRSGEQAVGDRQVQRRDRQATDCAPRDRVPRGSATTNTLVHPRVTVVCASTPRRRPGRPSNAPAALVAPRTGRPVAIAWSVDGSPLSVPATSAAGSTIRRHPGRRVMTTVSCSIGSPQRARTRQQGSRRQVRRSPRLVEDAPSVVGIGRTDLHDHSGLTVDHDRAALDLIVERRLDPVRTQLRLGHLGLSCGGIRRHGDRLGVLIGFDAAHPRSVGTEAACVTAQ